MRVLIIGDIVGKTGQRAVIRHLPTLKKEWEIDFCVANGENLTGGAGLSETTCRQLHHAGVDVVTSGDHIWDQRDFVQHIRNLPFVVRPANLHPSQPGRSVVISTLPDGTRVAVITLLGQIYIKLPADNPFRVAEEMIGELRLNDGIRHIIVDFHAEATSEKKAMGYFLDGKVSVVFGTHTHVPTADEQILPNGTAYITDVGMVGAADSILGRNIKAVVHRFVTGLPAKFLVETSNVELDTLLVELDANGTAVDVQRRKIPSVKRQE